MDVHGTVRGSAIWLEHDVPDLEGKRVRVHVEIIDEDSLSADEQRDAWHAWIERGPQGPIDDDDTSDWP